MSEADFAKSVEVRLLLAGRRVLRTCDAKDGRHGLYGMRAVTRPQIDSTGADYLVLPRGGMAVVLARDAAAIGVALRDIDEPFFLELKDPKARVRKDQVEQDEWISFVRGEIR